MPHDTVVLDHAIQSYAMLRYVILRYALTPAAKHFVASFVGELCKHEV